MESCQAARGGGSSALRFRQRRLCLVMAVLSAAPSMLRVSQLGFHVGELVHEQLGVLVMLSLMLYLSMLWQARWTLGRDRL